MKPPRLVPVLGLALALVSGCASKNDKAATAKDKDEYVYYTPTGSNIPVRVRKSDVQTTEADTQATQDIFRQVQSRGSTEHHGGD